MLDETGQRLQSHSVGHGLDNPVYDMEVDLDNAHRHDAVSVSCKVRSKTNFLYLSAFVSLCRMETYILRLHTLMSQLQ